MLFVSCLSGCHLSLLPDVQCLEIVILCMLSEFLIVSVGKVNPVTVTSSLPKAKVSSLGFYED